MAHRNNKVELSLVVAFGNCEETIGRQITGAVSHLRALRRPFEVVAVNEGSRDNSVAVLELLRTEIPEMRIVARDCSGRAFARGAAEARGEVLVMSWCRTGASEMGPWAGLGWALGRLDGGHDAVVCRGRYVVARHAPCAGRVVHISGTSPGFERRFERQTSDLAVAIVGSRRLPATVQSVSEALLSPLRRLALSDRG